MLLHEQRHHPFDLARAPLMRLAVARMADDEVEFAWTHHHLLLDGWSLPVLLNEIFACYDALRHGDDLTLEAVHPYRKYIEWLSRQDLARAEAFWRLELAEFAEPTPLPIGRIGSPGEPERYEEQQVRLSAEATSALQGLTRRHQLTLNTVVQGAWALLLSRYSGRDDVVFGATVAGRPTDLPGIESMVGLFINTLPVRARIVEDRSLLDWLLELQDRQAEARQFEYSPLVEVQAWSELPPNVALFDSILVVENYPLDSAVQQTDDGLVVRAVRSDEWTSYPLTAAVMPGPELTLAVSFDCRRFEAAPVTRLLGHFRTLLEGIAADPTGRLADLPLLTDAELSQLAAWNETAADFPGDGCIHELVAAQAARTPEATAAIFGEQRLSYVELLRRARQLAHHLRAVGVGPGSRVGISAEPSLDLLVGLLGVLEAGGAYLPLDPDYPPDRLTFMLEDAGVAALLTQEALVDRLPPHAATVILLDADWGRIAAQPATPLVGAARPEDVAYVIYTSGSTGRPKGVSIPHRALVNHSTALAGEFELGPDDRVLQFASISFDVAAEEIFPTLLSGATIVLRPDRVTESIPDFLRFAEQRALSVVNLPTPYWHELVSELSQSGAELPPSLRLVVAGSEKALPERLTEWQRLVGDRVRWLNAYGPTETTITATVYEPTPGDGERQASSVAIGRPIANLQVHVLDAALRPTPVRVPGELYIGGAGLARGYLDRPDLTAERFVPDPFADTPGGRLYRTGDLVRYREDGVLEFLGRVDDQVKVRGFRIELGEIEASLARHPAVRDVAVLAREERPGETRLVACLVAEPEAELDLADLRAHLKGQLPEYMVPAAFAVLEALPRTPSGKLDRRALLGLDDVRTERGREFKAPRDVLELQLAQIWQEVLGGGPLGISDDFFDLGGHSLLAVRLLTQIRARFNLELSLPTLFAGPTIEQLAENLRRRIGPLSWTPLVAIQPRGTKPSIFFVHPIGGNVLAYHALAQALGPDRPFYGLQAADEDGERQLSIEALAARYVEAVRAQQPTGPYVLGGWSFGGLVAFEMARQLRTNGREVALVALLDTLPPRVSAAADELDEAEILAWLAGELARQSGRGVPLSSDDLRALEPAARVPFTAARLEHAGVDLPDDGTAWVRRFLDGFTARLEAEQRYEAGAYDGRIALFRAGQPEPTDGPDESSGAAVDYVAGWQRYSTGPLTVIDVPGSHATMVSDPHARVLADHLTTCIDQAIAEQGDATGLTLTGTAR